MEWERPPYTDVIDPETFCVATRHTLQFWLDVHTNRDAWTENWLVDCDASYTFNQAPIISNDFFTFDWKAAAYKTLALDYAGDFVQCAACGSLWDASCFDCDCEEDNEENTEPVDVAYLEEYLSECEFTIPDAILERALWSDGFDAYREALAPVTAGIEEEIQECLDAIAAAKSNYSLIQACMWATGVYHVNGNVMEDYGDYTGLDYRMIDDIRNNGLESQFDKDDIREFITS